MSDKEINNNTRKVEATEKADSKSSLDNLDRIDLLKDMKNAGTAHGGKDGASGDSLELTNPYKDAEKAGSNLNNTADGAGGGGGKMDCRVPSHGQEAAGAGSTGRSATEKPVGKSNGISDSSPALKK